MGNIRMNRRRSKIKRCRMCNIRKNRRYETRRSKKKIRQRVL